MDIQGNTTEGEGEAIASVCNNSPTRIGGYSRFALFFSSTGHVVGSLHGEYCSTEEYFEIPNDFGDYDYIDGKLEFRPMANANHGAIENMLNAIFFHR